MFWLIGLTICLLGIIAFQDLKERAVSWILFPTVALTMVGLNFINLSSSYFYWSISINCVLVSIILMTLYFYAKFKMRRPLTQVFGIGDILFFYAFALGFPSVSFIILFVFSVFFSLLIHLFLNRGSKEKHIPLAGLMSIFLILALVTDLLLPSLSLYGS